MKKSDKDNDKKSDDDKKSDNDNDKESEKVLLQINDTSYNIEKDLNSPILLKSYSFIQLKPENDIHSSLIQLTSKLKDSTPKEQITYLMNTHKKLKLILDNLNKSAMELYDSYQNSSSNCKERLKEYTDKRNKVQETYFTNKVEVEKLQSKVF